MDEPEALNANRLARFPTNLIRKFADQVTDHLVGQHNLVVLTNAIGTIDSRSNRRIGSIEKVEPGFGCGKTGLRYFVVGPNEIITEEAALANPNAANAIAARQAASPRSFHTSPTPGTGLPSSPRRFTKPVRSSSKPSATLSGSNVSRFCHYACNRSRGREEP